MSNFKRKLIEALLIIFTTEKTIQHFLSALFFLVDIQGIGKPDTGPMFHPSYEVMAMLNFILLGAFILGLLGKIKHTKWALKLIGSSAALDILLEIIFHGFFYITVSVIISTLLIIVIIIIQRARAILE